jgi:surface antigen
VSSTRWHQVHGRFWRVNDLPFRLSPAVVGGLTLLGCTSQQVAGPSLPPAPLPNFAVGNAYTFDDGRIERIAGISAGLVRWRGADGFVFTTTNNVLLPRVAWSDADARGERTMSITPAALFPLTRGNNVAFRAVRHTMESRGGAVANIAETWQCRVDDTARVATKAGDFDTFRVTCTLDTGSSGTSLTRTFFYAPAIDYYVRREDRTGTGETDAITLTAYTTAEPSLPADAVRTRAAVRQTALESVPSGEAMPWRDGASGISGTVRPVSTMRSARRGWCRVLEEAIEANAHRYHIERVACRKRDGRWQLITG